MDKLENELQSKSNLKNLQIRKLGSKRKNVVRFEHPDSVVTTKVKEQTDPWIEFAGMFKDDPLFDEFVEDMAIYRSELAKIDAHKLTSEEYRTE